MASVFLQREALRARDSALSLGAAHSYSKSRSLSVPQSARHFSSRSQTSPAPMEVGFYLDGKEKMGKGAQVKSRFAAYDEDIAVVHTCDDQDVDDAVASARSGFEAWSSMTGMERSKILLKAAQLIRENAGEIAVLESRDSGHCIAETKPAHVEQGVETLEYFGRLACKATDGKMIPLDRGSFAQVHREPYGVAAAIVAWNYPFNMALYKSSILLAAGNSVVMKPSEKTPINTVGLAGLFTQAGMPPGVFNVVQGSGSKVGKRLCENPGIDKVSFTGSTPVGRKILQMCSHRIKPCTLELGGKSPLIIFEDADILPAVKAAMIANFYSAGEICTNGTRIFVHERIYDEFLDKFAELTGKLNVGDPLDASVQIGSLVDEEHADSVRKWILKGVEEGATLRSGGVDAMSLPSHLNPNAFVAPTIFQDVQDAHTIAQEEIFGPVASVLKFSDTEEVIQRANNTPYGLAAGFFTKDLKKAHYVGAKLQAGIVWCNTFNIYAPNVPVGGFKESGFGREFGEEALDHCMHSKSVYYEMNPDAGGTDF